MDRWEYYNPNPVKDKRTGDCVVRAICKATGFDWETVFAGLMIQACALSDMPSANYVWGAYLYKHGYRRKLIEQSERYIYTVNDFLHRPSDRHIHSLHRWSCGDSTERQIF